MALKTLGIRMTSDTTGLEKGFRTAQSGISGLKASASSLNKTGLGLTALKGGLMDMAAGLAAVAGALTMGIRRVAAFGSRCIGLASEMNEVQNVIDVTFGQSTAKIDKFAKSADTRFGLSEFAAKRYAGTIGAMLKSTGIANDLLAEMSIRLTGLAGDLASFYDLGHDEAFTKIRAGLAGEIEPLRQLGINMSIASVEAFALANGIKTPIERMSQGNQVLLRYAYLMKVTADAQGNFVREGQSWANMVRILGSNWETFMRSIGANLLPAFLPLLQVLNRIVQALTGAVNWFGGLNSTTKFFLGTSLLLLAVVPLLNLGIYGVGQALKFYQAMTAAASATTVAFVGTLTRALGWLGIIMAVLGLLSGLFGSSGKSAATAASGVGSAGTAMQGARDAANDASGAVKNLDNSMKGLGKTAKGLSLASFDQINQLNKKSGGGIGIGINQADLTEALEDLAGLREIMQEIDNAELTLPEVEVPDAWTGILNLFGGIAGFIADIGGFGDTWQQGWDTIMQSESPISTFWNGLVDMFKGGIEEWGKFFTNQWNKAVEDFNNKVGLVKLAFTLAGAYILSIWNSVSSFFSGVWAGISNAATTTWDWIKTTATDAWNWVVGAWEATTDFFGNLWESITGAFKAAMNGILSGIQKAVNGAIDGLNALIRLANNIPGVNIKVLGHVTLPRLAAGAFIESPTVAVVGEEGKEIVAPLERNTGWVQLLAKQLIPAMQTMRPASAGGGTIHIPIYLDGSLLEDVIINAEKRRRIKTNGM